MLENKKVMAIIPARGGSKRLPRKNILPLNGKPLISWTIEAASQSKYIDTVFVSTDDMEISSVSVEFGAYVPELRPEELASDTATTESVIFHSLNKFGTDIDVVVVLQPTSPLRNSNHIDEALNLFFEKNAFSVVSVTPCEHSPLWANTLPKDRSMGDFINSSALKRSQDLDEFYRLNGCIYIYDVSRLKELGGVAYTSESFAYVMDNEFSVDIDNQCDFDMAEFFMSRSVGFECNKTDN
jgi:N-acylneuraminate cytidylyltransferase